MGCHGHCYFSSNKLEILLNAGLDVDTPGLLHSSVAGSCHLGCFLIFVGDFDGRFFMNRYVFCSVPKVSKAFLNAWAFFGVLAVMISHSSTWTMGS